MISEYTQKLDAIFEKSKQPKIFLDKSINIVYMNKTAKLRYKPLCSPEGLKRVLSEKEISNIKSSLVNNEIIRHQIKRTNFFQALIFTKIYDKNGDLILIKLSVEDELDLGNDLKKLLFTVDFINIMKKEFLEPASNIAMAVTFLRKRYGDKEKILSKYLDLLDSSIFKIRYAAYNINTILELSNLNAKKDASLLSLSKSIRELASGFGVKFNCFITSDTNDTIIVNAGLFSKIFLDIFTFFMEQQNVGMKKMSDCYINLEESGDWWIIEVVKSNIRKQPEIKDVFMPLLSENNQVKINLFAVKQIITELGGNVIMPNNGRSKNQLCVIMSIPKLFQTGEYSMFLQDPIINLFDTLKLIYSTEYKYLESLMISN